ncbi:hypothetical protein NRB56_72510 [Nocardia sp. RB56]|uniref:Erythromycin esterase n=1 Tax=Nocardia aurantia TaxID=2585199 RepID=A0A7K0E2N3_9NOCA|nr:hypothetical protein [Nocardia aurantia]
MSTAVPLHEMACELDDPARAVNNLLAARAEPPTVLALGEPTHGIEAFPLLRNELLRHLAEHGYRSIALETDLFAAAAVDDYIAGAGTDIDTVLQTGFSHGFGAIPGNRELLHWLRDYNRGRPQRDRIVFHGFDAPTEYSAAPSPRRFLRAAADHLPAPLRPDSANDLEALLGDDRDWSNEAAMFDPAASVGTPLVPAPCAWSPTTSPERYAARHRSCARPIRPPTTTPSPTPAPPSACCATTPPWRAPPPIASLVCWRSAPR